MEGNRFMKHEVKNGLLDALGLCDQLRDSAALPSEAMTTLEARKHKQDGTFDSHQCMAELDLTLREVLDTILAQSMARDVMHGTYEPKVERVNDILSALYGVRGHSNHNENDRFPLVTSPSPLPVFLIDPQLLRFVHKNAISNACKYGKRGGPVVTDISFEGNEIIMHVINLPGSFHEVILSMGNSARKAVFEPGKRLHPHVGAVQDFMSQTHSSGDGGWIVKKCAKALGGDCSIKFEESRTLFSLRCPAVSPTERKMSIDLQSYSEDVDISNFCIPPNTWGICIDDSNIQRKVSYMSSRARYWAILGC